jgi:outer membrane protein TolC
MKKLLLLILPIFIYSDSLILLIDSAKSSNYLLKASALNVAAKKKELDSQQSSYYPTIDVGTAYMSFDEVSPFQAGNTLNVYAKAGVDLFDGYRKESLIKQKKDLFEASQYDLIYAQKALTLEIIQDFFNIKSLQETQKALKEKSNQLKADIKKIKKFRSAGLASQDYVDKLQSSYDANSYDLESLKLNIKTIKNYLTLKTGREIKTLENASLVNPKNLKFIPSELIKSLEKQADALEAVAKATNALYYPNVRLEDTYSYYDYSRDDGLKDMGIEQVKNQNKIALVAQMRLYDNGVNKRQKEAIYLKKQALQEQINHQLLEEKIRYKLAIDRLKTASINIQSAKSAFNSAKSAYKTIKAKFDAGIVDQVTYLDSLSQKTASIARYKKSLNDYEIAKANYYFRSNKNIKGFIK